MPKGSIEETRAATEAVLLREKIRQLEIGVANIRRTGKHVVDLLRLRDEVEEAMARLEANEAAPDLRPERTRIETVDNILYRKANIITRELLPYGGLAAARGEHKPLGSLVPLEQVPPEEHWWWYLDAYLAERRRKAAIKSIIFVVALGVVLVTANYLINRFFGLDPVEKEARGYTMAAEQMLREGDLDGAIEQYEIALNTLPSLIEARVTLGVLYEKKGRVKEAQQLYAQAEENIGDRATFLTVLARSYYDVGELEKALTAINEAIELAPDSAQAYLIRASVYETQDKVALAIEDLERSADLAQAQGQDSLYVLARMRMGMLLQRGPAMNIPGTGF